MLELRDMTKIYPAGGQNVEALRGIGLRFRSSEFVCVLGPSGCGKTTLLNLIGGLDQYTSGDLIINGRSTRDYSDRDWDAYRNHSIGFVFQSYHLIPHQSVLQNVELALTLAGVSKAERRRRAREALERVGLGDQLRKRPAEMSGGQMQRVAIARAIVNDPDIILADEPTGALDTETSIQVMDILREIARDRLVIMVTHNPDLAARYATRVIRMLDGRVTDDSAPPDDGDLIREEQLEKAKRDAPRQKLPSMSLRTSFGLSLRNLLTKKGRTILTSFAGSIGIIGIALIYAVSSGMTSFINNVQEDTLSSYPLTLERQHVDMSSMLQTFFGSARSAEEHADDGVYQKTMIYDLVNAMSAVETQENNLTAFREHLESIRSDGESDHPLRTDLVGVQYTYDVTLPVYTRGVDGEILASDPEKLMQELMGSVLQTDFSAMLNMRNQFAGSSGTAMMSTATSLWRELLPGRDGRPISPLYEKQYDLVYGRWPARYDEVILVVDEDGELPDLMLYAMGLLPKDSVEQVMQAAMTRRPIDYTASSWTYEEICGRDYRVIPACDCYTADPVNGGYTDLRATQTGLQYLYDNAMQLHITGVIRPKKDALATLMSRGIGYTCLLTDHMIAHAEASEAVRAQLASPDTDILTGLPFPAGDSMTDAEKAAAFRAHLAGLDEEGKADLYLRIMTEPTDEDIAAAIAQQLRGRSREELEGMLVSAMAAQTGMGEQQIRGYLSAMSDEAFTDMVTSLFTEQMRSQYAAAVTQRLRTMTPAQRAAALDAMVSLLGEADCARLHDTALTFSASTLEANLRTLGRIDPDNPAIISLYASTFEGKDRIERAIAEYNDAAGDMEKITYTDYVGLMMSSVTTIINAISYVLIAFVAISLVVSSIMIGVITLISVQERTREIGILRAIGASRRNVSHMFNAETVIIGFIAGLMGVLITVLLCIPINLILHSLTGLSNLRAALPLSTALILIAISMLLTMFAGIIPARSAARKDPVVALRTE